MVENITDSAGFSIVQKEDLKIIHDLNRGNSSKLLKISRLTPYHDMEGKEMYEEKLFQEYMEKQGLTDDFLVSNKLKEIIDNSHPLLVKFIENTYREKFNRYFEEHPAISELLDYSDSLGLIQIASDKKKWMKSVRNRGIDRKPSFRLFNLLNEVSRSALIFEYIERKYRVEIDIFSSNNPAIQMLIPQNFYANLIDFSLHNKIISKNLKFWQVIFSKSINDTDDDVCLEQDQFLLNKEKIRELKILLDDIRDTYQTLKYLELIEIAKLGNYGSEAQELIEASETSFNIPEKRKKKSFKIGIDKTIFKGFLIIGLLLASFVMIISPSIFMFTDDIVIAFGFGQVFIVIVCLFLYKDKIFDFLKHDTSERKSKKQFLYSLELAYHRCKSTLLVVSVFFIIGQFYVYFVYAPQHLFVPVFLMLIVIFLATLGDPKKRAAIAIAIFLVFMPLLFAVGSMI